MIPISGTPLERSETYEDSPPWMAAGSHHDVARRNDVGDSSLTIGRNLR